MDLVTYTFGIALAFILGAIGYEVPDKHFIVTFLTCIFGAVLGIFTAYQLIIDGSITVDIASGTLGNLSVFLLIGAIAIFFNFGVILAKMID